MYLCECGSYTYTLALHITQALLIHGKSESPEALCDDYQHFVLSTGHHINKTQSGLVTVNTERSRKLQNPSHNGDFA